MYRQLTLNRRRVLQGLGVAAATATAGIVTPLDAALGVPAPADRQDTAPARGEPTLHAYRDYGWLRGFNVVPSWGARVEDAWWFYDGRKMRDEVALARQVHANCIRLWIEFTAWYRDPEQIAARFLDAVAAIAESGMKTMPCLFNRWHDSKFDYGGTYSANFRDGWTQALDYVRAMVTPLADDDRVLAWDLCNEPQAHDLSSELNRREVAWLGEVAAVVRASGARQPITIGTMNGGNIDTFAPLVDVLCAHPYARDRAGLEASIVSYRELSAKHSKPLLVNETIPGSLDDAVRAEGAKYYTELLGEAGFGWMGWALREGAAISTRRDRIDGNGFRGDGFHPFFTADGRLRPGSEFLREKPARVAPWEEVCSTTICRHAEFLHRE